MDTFYPFWTQKGEKYLCSLLNVEPGAFPIGSTDIFHESAVRLVEIIEQQMGRDGYIAVIEFVHKKRWIQSIRFVVLDVPVLMQSVGLSDIGKTLTPIPLYDEVEFYHLFSNLSSSVEVDFRNSCSWGKHELHPFPIRHE